MKRILLILFTILLAFFALYFFYLKDYDEKKLIKQGNEIVLKIEAYKLKKGHLPNNLRELGIDETEDYPLYYNKWDSVNYMVYFSLAGVGESMTYYSDSNEWEKKERGIEEEIIVKNNVIKEDNKQSIQSAKIESTKNLQLDNFPLWVEKIINKDNLKIKSLLKIKPSYQLLDINGDKIKECVILTSNEVLIFNQKTKIVDKITKFYSISPFEEDVQIEEWSTDTEWIKEWETVSGFLIKKILIESGLNDNILGDALNLLSHDGKVTMFFDGKNYKWLYYD